MSTPVANSLSDLISLYNDSDISSYELGEFFSNYIGTYTVEQAEALLSDRVTGGTFNGIKLSDDATEIYNSFRGDTELETIANHFVSLQGQDASPEEALALQTFIEILNETKTEGAPATFSFNLDSGASLA